MGGAKKNKYLTMNPTEAFSMRFSEKYADQIVAAINEKSQEEDRSFPGTLERMLVQHLKLDKKNKTTNVRNKA